MTDIQRVYVPFDPSTGFPAENDLYFECLQCGDVIPTLPDDNVHCKCRNIMIDVDYGRVAVREQDRVRLFRRTVDGSSG